MSDNHSEKVTIRYDGKGKIVGWTAGRNVVAVVGSDTQDGTISVDSRVFQAYRDEMGGTEYLRVKDGSLTIPRSQRFLKRYRDFRIWFYHFQVESASKSEQWAYFLGQTVFGQIVVASVLSFIVLAVLKYLVISEHIEIYDYGDFVRYYMPILSAFFIVAFGAIGINGANQRFKESRMQDIEPVFLINAREKVKHEIDVLRFHIESNDLATMKSVNEDEIQRQNYSILNVGKGAAFNVWAFIKKESGGYRMCPLFNIAVDERIDITFSRIESERLPSYIYFVYGDTDGNRRVTSFWLNARTEDGKAVATTIVKGDDPTFKDIAYQSARYFGALYGKR